MELSATRVVNRPAAEVFAFIADSTNNTKWQQGMRSCRWTSDPPIGIGSSYEQEAKFLGRTIRTSFAVSDFEADRTIAIESTASTFPITVRRSVEPIDDQRSRVRAEIGGGPRVPSFLQPLMRRLAQRSVDRDYDRLVVLLEM